MIHPGKNLPLIVSFHNSICLVRTTPHIFRYGSDLGRDNGICNTRVGGSNHTSPQPKRNFSLAPTPSHCENPLISFPFSLKPFLEQIEKSALLFLEGFIIYVINLFILSWYVFACVCVCVVSSFLTSEHSFGWRSIWVCKVAKKLYPGNRLKWTLYAEIHGMASCGSW